MRLPILVVAALVGQCAYAQITFQKSYSSNSGGASFPTTDGGYAMVSSNFQGNDNMALLKVNEFGAMEWAKSYGGSEADHGRDGIQTHDQGYMMVGNLNQWNPSPAKFYAIRTDAAGNKLWEKTYASTGRAFSVKQTADRGFIIAGEAHDSFNGGAYLVKTDSMGNMQWDGIYSYGNSQPFREVLILPDGHFLALGNTYTNVVIGGITVIAASLIKVDKNNGNVLWSKMHYTPDFVHTTATSMCLTADGGTIFTGFMQEPGGLATTAFLMRTDSMGDVLWSKKLLTDSIHINNKLIMNANSELVITSQVYTNGSTGALMKLDQNGNFIWEKRFPLCDDLGAVSATADNGYIVSGGSYYINYLIKTNSNGTSNCNETDHTATTVDYPFITLSNAPSQWPQNIITTLNNPTLNPPITVDTICFSDPCLDLTLDVTQISCYGSGDGSIDLTVNGGIPPYVYNWSTGDTAQDISGLGPGTYVVDVFNPATNCQSSYSIIIYEPASLNSQISVTDATQGNNDGAIDLSTSGGTPPYSFQWSNGATTEDVSGLATGWYTVTITDAMGCIIIHDIFISISNGLAELNKLLEVKVWPNPTNGLLTIAYQQNELLQGIELYQINGRLVAAKAVDSNSTSLQFNLSEQAKGMYYLKLNTTKGVLTRKVVRY